MIQEDKQLLFVELSSRLPYRVKCLHPHGVGELDSIEVKDYGIHVIFKTPDDNYYLIEDCKPYLRPMSSMTEEEEVELGKLIGKASYNMMHKVDFYDLYLLLEFIYKKHLDYNHLIEKGLAIEAPKDMYK